MSRSNQKTCFPKKNSPLLKCVLFFLQIFFSMQKIINFQYKNQVKKKISLKIHLKNHRNIHAYATMSHFIIIFQRNAKSNHVHNFNYDYYQKLNSQFNKYGLLKSSSTADFRLKTHKITIYAFNN